MAWKEISVMDQREEFIRLALLDGTNRRELCRRFGISAQTGYKWLRRHLAGEPLSDVSRRPASSPMRTVPAMETAILAVRDAHPVWGARKIAAFLSREGLSVPAVSTIHAVLRRHGRIVSGPTGAVGPLKRFEAAAPNRLWQMDFKGRVRLRDGSACHPLTVIDDHSRFVVCLASCADEKTATVQSALQASFAVHGLPEALLVDNGPPWGAASVHHRWTPLRIWLSRLEVGMIFARPFHPQTKGKNERFNRTLNEEVLALNRPADLKAAQSAFDRWRQLYNHSRPHEALGQDVPASRYRLSERPMPETLPQIAYAPGTILRKVPKTRAEISFRNRLWGVPRCFRGMQLAIRHADKPGVYGVYFAANRVATIDLNS